MAAFKTNHLNPTILMANSKINAYLAREGYHTNECDSCYALYLRVSETVKGDCHLSLYSADDSYSYNLGSMKITNTLDEMVTFLESKQATRTINNLVKEMLIANYLIMEKDTNFDSVFPAKWDKSYNKMKKLADKFIKVMNKIESKLPREDHGGGLYSFYTHYAAVLTPTLRPQDDRTGEGCHFTDWLAYGQPSAETIEAMYHEAVANSPEKEERPKCSITFHESPEPEFNDSGVDEDGFPTSTTKLLDYDKACDFVKRETESAIKSLPEETELFKQSEAYCYEVLEEFNTEHYNGAIHAPGSLDSSKYSKEVVEDAQELLTGLGIHYYCYDEPMLVCITDKDEKGYNELIHDLFSMNNSDFDLMNALLDHISWTEDYSVVDWVMDDRLHIYKLLAEFITLNPLRSDMVANSDFNYDAVIQFL